VYESKVSILEDLEGDEEADDIEYEAEGSETETIPRKKATKKPSTPSKPAMVTRKSSTPKKTTFLDLVEDNVDITEMFRGLLIREKNSSLEINDLWKQSWHLKTLLYLQYYEACVEIFMQAPILPDQIKFNLSNCGMFPEYQRFIPFWFGSYKNF
jgi:hypothetical protein